MTNDLVKTEKSPLQQVIDFCEGYLEACQEGELDTYAVNQILDHARSIAALEAKPDGMVMVPTVDKDDGERFRHKKRGSTYTLIGYASVQTAEPIHEGDVVAVYYGEKGDRWARPAHEFNDGRFEALSAAPTTVMEPAP